MRVIFVSWAVREGEVECDAFALPPRDVWRRILHCCDLLRYLNIASADEAIAVVMKYFDASQMPPKTRLALEKRLPSA